MRETSAVIGLEAAEWAIRVDHAPLTRIEQVELDAWLAEDIRHAGAFARAQAMLVEARRMKALGLSAEAGSHEMPMASDDEQVDGSAPVSMNRRKMLAGAGAAAIAAGLLASVKLGLFGDEAYATQRGEIRLVPLPDGSQMTMNTATTTKVRFTEGERRVELADGEALFDVAKDAARPFVVVAGTARIRAVGTSFTVRRIAGRPLEVMVREGVVEVRHAGDMAPRRISANMRLAATETSVGEAHEIDAHELGRELAWREGMLSFEDQTLGQVADEFARYNDVAILFSDPSISRETITGIFSANDPAGFARAASLSLGLKVESSNGAITLRR